MGPTFASWSRRATGALASAALAAGCAASHIEAIPALDPARLAGADAIVIEDKAYGAATGPEGVVRGAGEGAATAMAQWAGGGSVPTGGEPLVGPAVALAIMLAGLPVAAIVGAAIAPSEEEVDRARAAYAGVIGDPALLPSLPGRIAAQARNDAPPGWACVAVATAQNPSPCEGAKTPARLLISASFIPVAQGSFDPDIAFNAMVEAELIYPSGEAEEMRWRYHSPPANFFDLAARDGAPLRNVIDAMLDRLAAAIARDSLTDPQPLPAEIWSETTLKSFFDQSHVQANAPTEMKPGVVRRMHPREPSPLRLEAPVKAIVLAREAKFLTAACAIAEIDGEAPPPPLGDIPFRAGFAPAASADPGEREFAVRCPLWSKDPPKKIVATVEAGRAYCTDGTYFRHVTGEWECHD